MGKVTCQISISLDGFVAGPNQSVDNPIGEGGMRLHDWVFGTASWRRQQGQEGGAEGADSEVAGEVMQGVGAYVMGRNMRMLLEAGADPNQESRGESEGTPLCAAASWGHTEIVRLLLDHGADPNLVETANQGPMTALAWARREGHADSVELLLKAGADPRFDPA